MYRQSRKSHPFIDGQRGESTDWCDWDIPLHWGGVSDPFQPAEKKHGVSLACLKVFAETQYPFVVSTKGTRLLSSPEYLRVLAKCNAFRMPIPGGMPDALQLAVTRRR